MVHVSAILVIAVMAIALWQPAPGTVPSAEQTAKIEDLAALMASPSLSAQAIDDRLRSFGPFQPDPNASRALAEALVTCSPARLDASQRAQLARQLYGITVIDDLRADAIPAALIGIEQLVVKTGCGPVAIDELMRAARAVARTDPNPRRDWW
jgi:hypothetical protein